MGVLDKFLDAIKLNDDYDDDGFLDDDLLSCVFPSLHRIRLPLPVIREWTPNARWLTVLPTALAVPSIPVLTTWLILIREHSCLALTSNFNS